MAADRGVIPRDMRDGGGGRVESSRLISVLANLFDRCSILLLPGNFLSKDILITRFATTERPNVLDSDGFPIWLLGGWSVSQSVTETQLGLSFGAFVPKGNMS